LEKHVISTFRQRPNAPLCAVRVPIPVVLFLAITVVVGVWWNSTRNLDFTTPPPEAKLKELRTKVESSFPQLEETDDAISQPVKPPEPEKLIVVTPPPKPEIDPGDLSVAPTLNHYYERTPQGAAPLMELAAFLETKGQFQRALLAWERVLDLTKPDASQTETAIASIKRLRPTLADWTTDPKKAIPITIKAGTGKAMAKTLAPVLEKAGRDIERASSGLIKVTTNITAGKANLTAKGPAPVALWITGAGKKPNSTEVLSFTADSPDSLHAEIMKSVFQLVRDFLSQSTSFTPPAPLAQNEDPQEALTFRVTRLCWNDMATSLNLPPKTVEPPAKKPAEAPKKPAASPKKKPGTRKNA
jgi:hypothetical protein